MELASTELAEVRWRTWADTAEYAILEIRGGLAHVKAQAVTRPLWV